MPSSAVLDVPEPGVALPSPRRRRPRRRGRSLPYLLLVPTLLALGFVLGYPLVRLVVMSFQEFGLPQAFGKPAPWVGFDNYRKILTDDYFWTVLIRTVIFAAVNVALTMTLGFAVALLLKALGKKMRILVSTGLVLAWAMPALTATVVWQWLFDTQYGLVNWVLTRLGGDYQGHSWLSEPISFFSVATIIVVWMGVPFVAFTLYAGLSQVPPEIVDAAHVDGARSWQMLRHITIPLLKPILLLLTALSILWDIRVFTQVYVLQRAGGIARETNLLGVWAYRVSIGENRFDTGAAIAVVMVILTLLLSVGYLHQLVRQEDM